MVDNTDVLRFVNEQCDFLSAFSPLQSHYIKQKAEDDILLAVIISQAMNHGRLKLSKISDIPIVYRKVPVLIIIMLVAVNMKVNGKMVYKRVLVLFIMLVVKNMKVNGQKEHILTVTNSLYITFYTTL